MRRAPLQIGPLTELATAAHAAAMAWYIEQAAAFLGLAVRILNQGQHYQFKRGALLLEWWPSTGKTGIGRRYVGTPRVRTLRALRYWLADAKKKENKNT